MSQFSIAVPEEFSFDQCLDYLRRSSKEILHYCDDQSVTKLLAIDGQDILFRVTIGDSELDVEILVGHLTKEIEKKVTEYISEWFDLETDLKPFYKMAREDDLLKPLVKNYYGYRIISIPDLFESLTWAVLGQQINLQFAYTLKQRFVQAFGRSVLFNDKHCYEFPKPDVVSLLNDEHLLPLQFSRQKSKYVVLIAEAFASGTISKEQIKKLPFQEAKEKLMQIKGIGNWTANYALMKTFRYPNAFPLEDAGLHNAIKNLKGMKAKPTLEHVKRLFKRYKGWEAYATLYLWKSL